MANKHEKTGIELIAEERQRQIEEEGWSAEHDQQWTHGELCRAAACYIARPSWVDTPLWENWPFDISWWKPTPQDRIRELQKAGALIAAEIDRLLTQKTMETKHKEFKPYDKVLVRDTENVWQPDFYGFYDKCRDNHTTMTDAYISDDNILPYEGNEELVGTTDEPSGEVKSEEEIQLEEGERIFVADEIEYFLDSRFSLRIFQGLTDNMFVTNAFNFQYAIRPGDANPLNMAETIKHALCVKDGKIVKFKG